MILSKKKMRNAKPKTNRQKPKALKDVEVVFCEMDVPVMRIAHGEDRRGPDDWLFDFRANVPADHLRNIRAFSYVTRWRIVSNLPGRLAAIVALKERAMEWRITLLEVFGVWSPDTWVGNYE